MELQGSLTINGKKYGKGDFIAWYKVYPFFLLPLWCSFYWRRGIVRFSIGVVTVLLLLTASLAFTSADLAQFGAQLKQMLGWTSLSAKGARGFWELHAPAYRIPVLAAFLAVAGSMALWPAQKHLGALLSCSAAVMLATLLSLMIWGSVVIHRIG